MMGWTGTTLLGGVAVRKKVPCVSCAHFDYCERHDVILEGLRRLALELQKLDVGVAVTLTLAHCPDFRPW